MRSFFLGTLTGLLLAALLLARGIRFLPQLLVVGHEPTPADAIVALSGDGDGSRLRAATRLYDQGLAPLLVHVNGQKMTKATVQKLCPDCKLEEKQVIFLEGSTDTRTDAELSLQYCRANNLRTILVVTSPYHTRRTQFIFNDVAENLKHEKAGAGTGKDTNKQNLEKAETRTSSNTNRQDLENPAIREGSSSNPENLPVRDSVTIYSQQAEFV